MLRPFGAHSGHSVCVHSVVAAENRSIAAVDIGGAFLHADMSDEIKVHMRLEPRLSAMMVELDQGYREYIDKKAVSQ